MDNPPLEAELKTYQLLENKIAYQWSPYGLLLRDQPGLCASASYYAARYISRLTTVSQNYYQQKRLRHEQAFNESAAA